jgi:hypothetical protein
MFGFKIKEYRNRDFFSEPILFYCALLVNARCLKYCQQYQLFNLWPYPDIPLSRQVVEICYL